MSIIDSDPPKHNNLDVFNNPKKYNLHGKGLNLEGSNRVVIFNMDEIRALVKHQEKPIIISGGKMSKKMYKLALEQKHRAQEYIKQDLKEKNDNRSYYARDLVVFAKFGVDKSSSGQYLLFGYFNNESTKFKDVLTGKIYPLGVTVLAGSNPHSSASIKVNGETFIRVGMRIQYNNQGVKYKNLWFSDKCVFSKMMSEPFAEFSTKAEYPNLYDFVAKWQNSSEGVVTAKSLQDAVNEANKYAAYWLAFFGEDTKDCEMETMQQDIEITKEEREF